MTRKKMQFFVGQTSAWFSMASFTKQHHENSREKLLNRLRLLLALCFTSSLIIFKSFQTPSWPCKAKEDVEIKSSGFILNNMPTLYKQQKTSFYFIDYFPLKSFQPSELAFFFPWSNFSVIQFSQWVTRWQSLLYLVKLIRSLQVTEFMWSCLF